MDPTSTAPAVISAAEYSQTLTFLGLPLLAWIPLFPLLGALINLTLGRKLSRGSVYFIAIAAVAAAFGIVAYLVFGPLFSLYNAGPKVLGTGIEQNVYTWIEVKGFTAKLMFRLDTLTAVMVLIITFIGSLIHIYSTGYMAHDPRYSAFFGYLNLFTGAMLILVLAGNLPVMFIGWEGVGLCSYLLIGFWYENEDFATAGRKAFVVNRIGDFCFLLGMFLLYWATKDLGGENGSLDFATLKSAQAGVAYVQPFWGGERLAAAAGILLFIGACGKSAQLPLYVWLPDAMAGPTPVSALIHAATMVTAGVYMVCRMSFLYSASTTALIVVSTVGLLTALAAAFMAFAQTDLKKVLAYSTVSQLGFMFVAAGTGNWTAAIFHLGTHAFFKACLFLGAGSVMHGMEHGGSHTPGDITTMGGLRKHMPITRITFMISCLAIAGIFPFAGFWSKDEILGGAFHVHPPGWPVWYGKFLWAGLCVAALGTAFYMWRLYFMVFSGEERSDAARKAHESPVSMTSALVLLAFFATVIGVIGAPELHRTKLPAPTHALRSWLAPAVTHEWHEGMPIEGELPPAGEISACTAHKNGDACVVGTEKGECEEYEYEKLSCETRPESDTGTFSLLGIALAIAIVGIVLAWMLYGAGPRPSPTVDQLTDGPLHGFWEASKHKLWVDEIYEVIFVRPFRLLARGLYEVVDRFIIDTVAVNGAAFVVGLFGRVSRWFQNGQVQRYLAGLVVGAALVFVVTDCERKPTFSYEPVAGGKIHLHALPGEGLVAANVKLAWDLDGDGKPDRVYDGCAVAVDGKERVAKPADMNEQQCQTVCEAVNKGQRCVAEAKYKTVSDADLVLLAGDVGGEVGLTIEDPISGKTWTVRRTIILPSQEVKP